MASGHSPLANCPHRRIAPSEIPSRLLSPDFFPPDNYPWIISHGQPSSAQLLPTKLLEDNNLPNFCHPDNYGWMVSSWTVTPVKFPARQLNPALLPLEHFFLNNSSQNNWPPMKFLPEPVIKEFYPGKLLLNNLWMSFEKSTF